MKKIILGLFAFSILILSGCNKTTNNDVSNITESSVADTTSVANDADENFDDITIQTTPDSDTDDSGDITTTKDENDDDIPDKDIPWSKPELI